MRRYLGGILIVLALPGGWGGARADDAAEKLAEQKKAALANWDLLEIGQPVSHETAHLLLYAPLTYEKRLKEWGPMLEKHFIQAEKALQIEPKEELWAGKLTVYLFAEREQFTAFVRRVEKRRLVADEVGSYYVERDAAHVATSPPRSKLDPSVEGQAAEQIAAVLLQKKAGDKVPLPEWLLAGFGRATVWKVMEKDKAVQAERRLAFSLATIKPKRTAQEVWGGTLDADEAVPLRASLAEFLAYGPGKARFVLLVNGFKPEENQKRRTTEQALATAKVTPATIEKRWKEWLVTGK